MSDAQGSQPEWSRKYSEGKMFQRLVCDRCGTLFHFADAPRATRTPHYPACGNLDAHPPLAA